LKFRLRGNQGHRLALMATVIGATSGDGVMTSGDDQVVTIAGPSQKQQQMYAVLKSPSFHICVLALILCQIITASIHVSIMAAAGEPHSWTGPVMFFIALLFLIELRARMFVAGSWRCARTSYGKFDAVIVILFCLGAVANLLMPMSIVTLCASVGRVCRVDLIARSATWFLPRWAREIACLLITFPLCHLVWATLAVQMLHPVHVDVHERGDSDYDREALGNVGSAMIHMLPYNWNLFGIIIRNHPWTVVFIACNILNWVFFFGRAVVFGVMACRTKRSQEQERALTEALWTCELQISEACRGGQTFRDGRAEAERSQGM